MSTNNPPAVPGYIIRLLRNFKGMMQKHACEKMDISQQAYSRIELREKVTEKKVAEILQAFNSNLQELEYIIKNYPPHKNKITAASFIIPGINCLCTENDFRLKFCYTFKRKFNTALYLYK